MHRVVIGMATGNGCTACMGSLVTASIATVAILPEISVSSWGSCSSSTSTSGGCGESSVGGASLVSVGVASVGLADRALLVSRGGASSSLVGGVSFVPSCEASGELYGTLFGGPW